MKASLKCWIKSESGAISADFVVLSGLVIALCFLITIPLGMAGTFWSAAIGDLAINSLSR